MHDTDRLRRPLGRMNQRFDDCHSGGRIAQIRPIRCTALSVLTHDISHPAASPTAATGSALHTRGDHHTHGDTSASAALIISSSSSRSFLCDCRALAPAI